MKQTQLLELPNVWQVFHYGPCTIHSDGSFVQQRKKTGDKKVNMTVSFMPEILTLWFPGTKIAKFYKIRIGHNIQWIRTFGT